MARTKAVVKQPASDKATSRATVNLQLHVIFTTIFLASSLAAAWFVRIRPAINGQPIQLEENLSKGLLALPLGSEKDYLPIRQDYTGIEQVDVVLRTLVAAFIAGPGRFDVTVWLQQFHFLIGFAPMLAIHVIESCRAKWKSSWTLRYTFTWGILYQTLAGALALPWWQTSFLLASKKHFASSTSAKASLATGQRLSTDHARAALPAVILVYVLPTAAMYLVPIDDLSSLMALVAFWMITPVILDLVMDIFSTFYSFIGEDPGNAAITIDADGATPDTSIPPPKKTNRPDALDLYTLYGILTFIAFAAHFQAVYAILFSDDPWDRFHRVFVPDFADGLSSTVRGFHNIFQWDWCFVAAQQVLWALYALYELRLAGVTKVGIPLATLAVVVLTVVLGPGGVLSAVWWWRETILVGLADEAIEAEEAEKKAQ